ncbi:helix-turn-helix transcriptional regulator [Paraburkholderia megapolitana]|uniref:helix-turn-helix transcriptional regulator n=1 Tax=Paraburkholderia megapolitana TaxID=420953 RepID=UPI0038B6B876
MGEEDDEPIALLASLAVALERAGVPLIELSRTLACSPDPAMQTNAIQAIVRALEIAQCPVVLLIEDLHRLRNPRVDGVLSTLIERMPPNVRLGVSSRTRPNLPLARLRARGLLLYLGTDDLRFTFDETAEYLTPEISAPVFQTVYEQTEGWPAALQLAKIDCMSERGAYLLLHVGRIASVAQYFAEQVLANQPEDLRSAMLVCSVVEQMNGPLVNQLTGRTDGWQILERLETSNLCVALDVEPPSYRFPSLLAEYLRHRLARTDGVSIGRLHRLAAEWYFEHDAFPEWLRHAKQADDISYLLDNLQRVGGYRAALRRGPSMLSIFRELSPHTLASYPRLRIGQIYTMVMDHRSSDAKRALEQLRLDTVDFSLPDTAELRADTHILGLLLDAYKDVTITANEIDSLEREALKPASNSAQPEVLAEMTALGHYMLGNFEKGTSMAQIARRRCRDAGSVFIEIYCSYFEGVCEFERGNWTGAQQAFDEMLAGSVRLSGTAGDLAVAARIGLAELTFERGEDEAARALLLAAPIDWNTAEGWCDLYVSFFRTAQQLAPSSQASHFLAQAHDLARRQELPRVERAALFANLRRSITVGQPLTPIEKTRLTIAFEQLHETSDWRNSVPAAIAKAEFSLSDGRPEDALDALDLVTPDLVRRRHLRPLTRARLLAACAQAELGRTSAMRSALYEAIELGACLRQLRPFLDYSSMMDDEIFSCLEELGRACSDSGVFALELQQRIAVLAQPVDSESKAALHILSPQQHALLRLIANGETNKEAARHLGVSVNTVASYRKDLYRKLNSNRRSHVIATARSLGLL